MLPLIFDTATDNKIMSPQGQAMTPGFTDFGGKISLGVVYMPPAGIANAHKHANTDIIVSLTEAGPRGAITLWGEELENMIIQYMGQHLYMPAGIPHVAINPSKTDYIRACEYRSSGQLMLDNVLLPDLQWIATAVQQEVLTD